MIAFMFPGQGSQRPGAGRPWSDHPSWEVVRAASDAARRDIAHLLLDADADELRSTDNAQLSTYVASLLVLDAVRRQGLDATFVAGHSLGEYTALTAAGAISLEDGVQLVCERGAAMRAACETTEGTMAAVLGAEDDAIEALCSSCQAEGHSVWVANFNAPGQVVIAGSAEGVETAGARAKTIGAKRVMPVAVSGAFHTPFMATAQTRLDAALADAHFHQTTVAVATNVDAAIHHRDAPWAELLSRQLCSPVRWSPLLASLTAAGVKTFVEIGPGTVLSGLAKRGAPGSAGHAAAIPEEVDSLAGALSETASAASRQAGETLHAAERLVVSPAAGVFAPEENLRDGDRIAAGDVIGRVGGQVVTSRFSGRLMGVLAWRGERVAAWQPLLWLRAF